MRLIIATLAAGLLAGCGGGPTEEEENLTTTATHPEITANSAAAPEVGMGNPSTALGNETMRPDGPGGPVGVESSGGEL